MFNHLLSDVRIVFEVQIFQVLNFDLSILVDHDLWWSMTTISANVTKKEADAIREYANACGETMSNLIRKCLISEAVFRNFYGDANDYNFEIEIPSGISDEEENKIVLDTHNRIRKMLGLKEQDYV